MNLLKGTFIYSGGRFISRILSFLLLPLTTSYLTPNDYGIIGSLAIIPTLFFGLYTLGFSVSISRSYWSTEDENERSGIIWSGFITLLLNSLLLLCVAVIFSDQISIVFTGSKAYGKYVIWTAITMAFNCSILPFLTYLRLLEKAFLAASINFIEILLSLALLIYFVVFKEMGVEGVILAPLISQGVYFILLSFATSRLLSFRFAWHFLPELLHLGYPYIIGTLGYSILQTSSRYTLQLFSDNESVGLFFMAFNFARVVELGVGGFISAWAPFFNSYLKKQDVAPHVFGKILTYYVIAMCFVLSIFFGISKPIVYFMVKTPFFSVWPLVGIIATGLSLWGVYHICHVGLIFQKKNKLHVALELLTGLIAIAFNFAFIPFFGKMGAAFATLFSFLTLIVLTMLVNHKYLPIQYELNRIAQTSLGLFVFATITYIPIDNIIHYSLLVVSSLFIFWGYLWFYCLEDDEKGLIIERLQFLFKKRKTIESTIA